MRRIRSRAGLAAHCLEISPAPIWQVYECETRVMHARISPTTLISAKRKFSRSEFGSHTLLRLVPLAGLALYRLSAPPAL